MLRLERLHPSTMCAFLGAGSAAALGLALLGQYALGMHPCELCIWQRWPFIVAIILGISGFVFNHLSKPVIALLALTFITNAGIAIFHSGVERKWWEGLKGCSAPDLSGSVEDLMKRIQEAPVARCDELGPSLFGLTMANYNVVLCLTLATISIFYLLFKARQQG